MGIIYENNDFDIKLNLSFGDRISPKMARADHLLTM